MMRAESKYNYIKLFQVNQVMGKLSNNKTMRILITSHSTLIGGAELGLLHLAEHLTSLGHICSVIFPQGEGPLVDECMARKLTCFDFPYKWSLPVPSNALSSMDRVYLEKASAVLQGCDFDLIISNTVAIIFGAGLARNLGIPHITYCLELIGGDANLSPRGMSERTYIRLLGNASIGWIACSNTVANYIQNTTGCQLDCIHVMPPFATLKTAEKGTQNSSADKSITEVLEEKLINGIDKILDSFLGASSSNPDLEKDSLSNDTPIHLVQIGVQSLRKDPAFAVMVLNGLRKRGHDVFFDHYGSTNDGHTELIGTIDRMEMAPYVCLHGWLDKPAEKLPKNSILLITARSEPFGITVPECLVKNIPVVSSDCGGPTELLPEEWIYPIGDLEACVNTIERLIDEPKKTKTLLDESSNRVYHELNSELQCQELGKWLNLLSTSKTANQATNSDKYLNRLWQLSDIDARQLINGNDLNKIVAATSELEPDQWQKTIELEKLKPGTATLSEMNRLGLTPHAKSERLSTLYKESNAFLIELISNQDQEERALMSAFILVYLLDNLEAEYSRVLAFGDGLGIDSLQLIKAGFTIDYLDSINSKTAQAAKKFLEHALSNEQLNRLHWPDELPIHPIYHAVVCLEVIEHVESPEQLLSQLANCIHPGGFLLISECFLGVTSKYSTHLYSNLRFAGHLPALAAQHGFELIDINLSPRCKPFIFRRCLPGELPQWSWLWDNFQGGEQLPHHTKPEQAISN